MPEVVRLSRRRHIGPAVPAPPGALLGLAGLALLVASRLPKPPQEPL